MPKFNDPLPLSSYRRALKRRDDALRDTPHGKLEAAKQKQCTVSLEPFFKNLRKNRIADDVLARITEICEFMQQR